MAGGMFGIPASIDNFMDDEVWEMKWSKEIPKVDGFYFVRSIGAANIETEVFWIRGDTAYTSRLKLKYSGFNKKAHDWHVYAGTIELPETE